MYCPEKACKELSYKMFKLIRVSCEYEILLILGIRYCIIKNLHHGLSGKRLE